MLSGSQHTYFPCSPAQARRRHWPTSFLLLTYRESTEHFATCRQLLPAPSPTLNSTREAVAKKMEARCGSVELPTSIAGWEFNGFRSATLCTINCTRAAPTRTKFGPRNPAGPLKLTLLGFLRPAFSGGFASQLIIVVSYRLQLVASITHLSASPPPGKVAKFATVWESAPSRPAS